MDAYLIPAAVVLALTNIVFAALAARERHRAETAQRELTRLVAETQDVASLRPRRSAEHASRPPHYAAGYDTGLREDV